MRIIGIDPGNIESAFCHIQKLEDGTIKIVDAEIIQNGDFFEAVKFSMGKTKVFSEGEAFPKIYLEDIQAMGMPVGQEVFDTCKYIGRLQLLMEQNEIQYEMVKRTKVKLHHCGSTRAKDSNVIISIVDRFDPSRAFGKYGKGTIKNQGMFFGFKDDMWSAFAISLYGADVNV